MIMADSNETDVLRVKLKKQKNIAIMPLFKPERLKRVQDDLLVLSEQIEGWNIWYTNGRPKSVQDPSVTNTTATKASKHRFIQNMQPTNLGLLYTGQDDATVMS